MRSQSARLTVFGLAFLSIEAAAAPPAGAAGICLRGDGDVELQLNCKSFQLVDADGDGNLDFVYLTAGTGSMLFLFGDTGGSFSEERTATITREQQFLQAADLDGDGLLEFAAAGGDSVAVDVVGRDPDGTYRSRSSTPHSAKAHGLAMADFDGDGKADATLAESKVGEDLSFLEFLPGKGDSAFGTATRSETGTSARCPILAIALDDGGGIDLAQVLVYRTVRFYAGKGDGTFAFSREGACGDSTTGADAGDVDGDGRADLLTSNEISQDVSVLFQEPGGTFAPDLRLPVGGKPYAVKAVDLDKDGFAEVVAADREGKKLSVFRHQGPRSFLDPAVISTGCYAMQIAAGDIDRNGNVDVAVLNGSGCHRVSIHWGDGLGGLRGPVRYPCGANSFAAVAIDLDRDGILDVVTAQRAAPSLSVLRGLPDGGFSALKKVSTGSAPPIQGLAVGDFDGDGRADAVIGYEYAEPAILKGTGGVDFGKPEEIATGLPDFRILGAGDFDEDGALDLLATTGRFGDDGVFVTTHLPLLGKGDGTFRQGNPFASINVGLRLSIADMDGDGHLDLAAADSSLREAFIEHGRGDGTFLEGPRAKTGDASGILVAGDVDGDLRPDVLSLSLDRNRIQVLLGKGSALEAGPFLANGQWIDDMAVADLDADGRSDVAAVGATASQIFLFPGAGGGTFGDPVAIATGSAPQKVLVVPAADRRVPDLLVVGGQDLWRVENCATGGAPFRRCDANGDGKSGLSDAIWIVGALFLGGPEPDCREAADCNDDGAVGLPDAVYAIAYQFLHGPPPPAPFPDCGTDPTPDDLGCGDSGGCR